MPKKTKKQKILAQLHRKLAFTPPDTSANFVKSQNQIPTTHAQSPTPSNFVYSLGAVVKPNSTKSPHDYSYVKYDLIRITIFTLFAITLQSVLYFLLRTR